MIYASTSKRLAIFVINYKYVFRHCILSRNKIWFWCRRSVVGRRCRDPSQNKTDSKRRT